jgi:hypothetical protein
LSDTRGSLIGATEEEFRNKAPIIWQENRGIFLGWNQKKKKEKKEKKVEGLQLKMVGLKALAKHFLNK